MKTPYDNDEDYDDDDMSRLERTYWDAVFLPYRVFSRTMLALLGVVIIFVGAGIGLYKKYQRDIAEARMEQTR